jgi:hypothetical protein
VCHNPLEELTRGDVLMSRSEREQMWEVRIAESKASGISGSKAWALLLAGGVSGSVCTAGEGQARWLVSVWAAAAPTCASPLIGWPHLSKDLNSALSVSKEPLLHFGFAVFSSDGMANQDRRGRVMLTISPLRYSHTPGGVAVSTPM